MILLPILIILTTHLYDNSFARNIDRRHRSFDPKIFTTCIDGLGCIDVSEKWYDEVYRPKNLEPLDRHTIRTEFILMKSLQNDSKDLVYDVLQLKSETIEISGFKKGTCTKFMIHDFTSNGRTGWIKHLVVAFAHRTGCNLVSVDWEAGAEPPFEQAIANARVVALETQAMINMLKVNFSQSVEMLHLIGHGVGSHIAGYIGKNITGLGRITGLDPTGPYFERMPKEVRLDYSDANYVEIIHTDAHRKKSQGALIQLGHADFYANNAGHQPGCNDTTQDFTDIKRDGLKEGKILAACSHKRAFKYYIESVENPRCQFLGILCKNYEEFEKGQCLSCENNACLSFGLDAPSTVSTWNHSYYLITHDRKPFCVLPYTVTMVIDVNAKARDVEGYFDMILVDADNVIANATTANSEFKFRALKPGNKYQYLFYTSPPRLGIIKEAKVKWKRKYSKFCIFCTTSIYVSKIEIRPLELEHVKVTTSYLCPKKDSTEIEDNDFVTYILCNSKSSCETSPSCVTQESCIPSPISTESLNNLPQTEQFFFTKKIQDQQIEQVQKIDSNPQAAHGVGNNQVFQNQGNSQESFSSYTSSLFDKTTYLVATNEHLNEIHTNINDEQSSTDSNILTSLIIAPVISTVSNLEFINEQTSTPTEGSISNKEIGTETMKVEVIEIIFTETTQTIINKSLISAQPTFESATKIVSLPGQIISAQPTFESATKIVSLPGQIISAQPTFESATKIVSLPGQIISAQPTFESATKIVSLPGQIISAQPTFESATKIVSLPGQIISAQPTFESATKIVSLPGQIISSFETTRNGLRTTYSPIVNSAFATPFSSSEENYTKESSSNNELSGSLIESVCGKLREVSGYNEHLNFDNISGTDADIQIPAINPELLVIERSPLVNMCNRSDTDSIQKQIQIEASNFEPSLDEDWRLIRRKSSDISRSRKASNARKNVSKQKKFINATTVKSTLKTATPNSRNKRKKKNRKSPGSRTSTTIGACHIFDPNTCADIKEEYNPPYAKVKEKLEELGEREQNKNKTSAAMAENKNKQIESKLDDHKFNIMNVSDEQCSDEFGLHVFTNPEGELISKSNNKIEYQKEEESPVKGAANVKNAKITIQNTTPSLIGDFCNDEILSQNDTKFQEQLHGIVNKLNKALEDEKGTKYISHKKKISAISSSEKDQKHKIGAANLESSSFILKSTTVLIDTLETVCDDNIQDNLVSDVKIKSKERIQVEESATTPSKHRIGAANAAKSSNVVLSSASVGSDDNNNDKQNETDEEAEIKCKADKLVANVNNPLYHKDPAYLNNSFHSSFEADIENDQCKVFNSDSFIFTEVDKIEISTATTITSEQTDSLATNQEEFIPEKNKSPSKTIQELEENVSSIKKVGAAHGSVNNIVTFDPKLQISEVSTEECDSLTSVNKVFTVAFRTSMDPLQKMGIIIKDRVKMLHTSQEPSGKKKGPIILENDMQKYCNIKPGSGETIAKAQLNSFKFSNLKEGLQQKKPIVGAANSDRIQVTLPILNEEVQSVGSTILTKDVSNNATAIMEINIQVTKRASTQFISSRVPLSEEMGTSIENVTNPLLEMITSTPESIMPTLDESGTTCYVMLTNNISTQNEDIQTNNIGKTKVSSNKQMVENNGGNVNNAAQFNIQSLTSNHNVELNNKTDDNCMNNLDEILSKLQTSLGEILTLTANKSSNVSSANGGNKTEADQFKVEAGECFCYGDLQNKTEVIDINTESAVNDNSVNFTEVVKDDETTCFTMLQTAETIFEEQKKTGLKVTQASTIKNKETEVTVAVIDVGQETCKITEMGPLEITTEMLQTKNQTTELIETTLLATAEVNIISTETASVEISNTEAIKITVMIPKATTEEFMAKTQTEIEANEQSKTTPLITEGFGVTSETSTIYSEDTLSKISSTETGNDWSTVNEEQELASTVSENIAKTPEETSTSIQTTAKENDDSSKSNEIILEVTDATTPITVSTSNTIASMLEEDTTVRSFFVSKSLSTTLLPLKNLSKNLTTAIFSTTIFNEDDRHPTTTNNFVTDTIETNFVKLTKATQGDIKMVTNAEKPQVGQANANKAAFIVDLPAIEVNDGKTTELLVIDLSVEATTLTGQIIATTALPNSLENSSSIPTSMKIPIASGKGKEINLCDSNVSKDSLPDKEIDVYVNKNINSSAVEVVAKPHSGAAQSDRSFIILNEPRATTSNPVEELYRAIKMCSDIRRRRKLRRKRKRKVKRSPSKSKAGKYVVNIGTGAKLKHVPMKVVFDLKENGNIVGTTEYNIVHQEVANRALKNNYSSLLDSISDRPPHVNKTFLGKSEIESNTTVLKSMSELQSRLYTNSIEGEMDNEHIGQLVANLRNHFDIEGTNNCELESTTKLGNNDEESRLEELVKNLEVDERLLKLQTPQPICLDDFDMDTDNIKSILNTTTEYTFHIKHLTNTRSTSTFCNVATDLDEILDKCLHDLHLFDDLHEASVAASPTSCPIKLTEMKRIGEGNCFHKAVVISEDDILTKNLPIYYKKHHFGLYGDDDEPAITESLNSDSISLMQKKDAQSNVNNIKKSGLLNTNNETKIIITVDNGSTNCSNVIYTNNKPNSTFNTSCLNPFTGKIPQIPKFLDIDSQHLNIIFENLKDISGYKAITKASDKDSNDTCCFNLKDLSKIFHKPFVLKNTMLDDSNDKLTKPKRKQSSVRFDENDNFLLHDSKFESTTSNLLDDRTFIKSKPIYINLEVSHSQTEGNSKVINYETIDIKPQFFKLYERSNNFTPQVGSLENKPLQETTFNKSMRPQNAQMMRELSFNEYLNNSLKDINFYSTTLDVPNAFKKSMQDIILSTTGTEDLPQNISSYFLNTGPEKEAIRLQNAEMSKELSFNEYLNDSLKDINCDKMALDETNEFNESQNVLTTTSRESLTKTDVVTTLNTDQQAIKTLQKTVETINETQVNEPNIGRAMSGTNQQMVMHKQEKTPTINPEEFKYCSHLMEEAEKIKAIEGSTKVSQGDVQTGFGYDNTNQSVTQPVVYLKQNETSSERSSAKITEHVIDVTNTTIAQLPQTVTSDTSNSVSLQQQATTEIFTTPQFINSNQESTGQSLSPSILNEIPIFPQFVNQSLCAQANGATLNPFGFSFMLNNIQISTTDMLPETVCETKIVKICTKSKQSKFLETNNTISDSRNQQKALKIRENIRNVNLRRLDKNYDIASEESNIEPSDNTNCALEVQDYPEIHRNLILKPHNARPIRRKYHKKHNHRKEYNYRKRH